MLHASWAVSILWEVKPPDGSIRRSTLTAKKEEQELLNLRIVWTLSFFCNLA